MTKARQGLMTMAMLAAGCGAVEAPTGTSEEALSASDAIARAEQWVGADLQYCQSANHQRDYDDACTTYCERTDNSAWDPYRSDCSGLVSWAWGLPAPGRVTGQFAPFEDDISGAIDGTSLAPADALNNSDHIILFKAWVTKPSRATFIEEPGCATAITHAHQFESDVTINGSSVYLPYEGMTFTAIRYHHFGASGGGSGSCVSGGLYCGGDKVAGDPNTLYRCNGSGTPTLVEHCAEGCDVNPGSDDSCNSASPSGGGCVTGGLYCGGDKVSGSAGTLYRCNGAGAPSVVEQCAAGCQVNSGVDDSCQNDATNGSGGCTTGGLYCGGDKVSGSANTLYRCNGGGDPTVVEQCAGGCQVNPGVDDSCRSSGGSCVSGGLYCGGDKVSGSASTLYRCTGSGTPAVVGHCSDGCEVRSGQDDACRGSGGCVSGGLYCGGDKVTGDPSTLYRCNGAGAPSVVSHCGSGCEVLSGRNDACK
jgi:hypothetical protein